MRLSAPGRAEFVVAAVSAIKAKPNEEPQPCCAEPPGSQPRAPKGIVECGTPIGEKGNGSDGRWCVKQKAEQSRLPQVVQPLVVERLQKKEERQRPGKAGGACLLGQPDGFVKWVV